MMFVPQVQKSFKRKSDSDTRKEMILDQRAETAQPAEPWDEKKK